MEQTFEREIELQHDGIARIQDAGEMPPETVTDGSRGAEWQPTPAQRAYLPLKRLLDIIFSLLALIALSPLFLVVAVAIKIESEGSAIFKQTRVGKGGKLFMFYKFRSMCKDAEDMLPDLMKHNEADAPVFKMKNDPRLTKVGRFIRNTSIDELPQLLNILKGDMSFIGPRPPLPSEVEKYTDYQKRRLDVKGGLTCYWQIHEQRTNIKFDDWVNMDIRYIEEMSLWADIKLFFKTFPAVISAKGSH